MNPIPATQLLLLGALGVLVALMPLALVWAARGQDRLRRLAWVAVFLTFDLVVFGAFTRLTDSGLGCPDWPGCFAQSNPLAASSDIEAAQRLLPSGPVTMTKAWIEMIHRVLAMALGLIIVVMAVVAWRERQRAGRSPGLATLGVGLVCLQGAFGALTVTDRLRPAIVTTHLLLGLALLALLTWHAARFECGDRARAPSLPHAVRLRWLAPLGLGVLALQIALGGWVSTNYAVLACSDFPLCQGQWLPPMDLRDGFTLWRELGKTASNQYLPFEALTAIHFVHRTFAGVATVVLGALVVSAWRVDPIARLIRLLAAVLMVQCLSGIANVVLDWPLLAAVLHNAGAAALVLILVMLNYRLYAAPGHSPTASMAIAHSH